MTDPTYSREAIDKNPVWRLAAFLGRKGDGP